MGALQAVPYFDLCGCNLKHTVLLMFFFIVFLKNNEIVRYILESVCSKPIQKCTHCM